MQRNAWGIATDGAGAPAYLGHWAWFWRYAAGLILITAASWLALQSNSGHKQWMVWLACGGAILWALTLMHELGCLVVVAAIFGGIWFATEALFPDFHISDSVKIGIIAAFAYYAWDTANQAKLLASSHSKALESLQCQMGLLDASKQASSEHLHSEILAVKDRVRMLERERDDPFGLL